MKLQPLTRNIELRADPVSDSREIELSFSSEEPVERFFGDEILVQTSKAANLERLNDGAPLLFNHNLDDVIGVVEKAWIGDDKRGHAVVRLAKTERGNEVLEMVNDHILRNVSFMYRVHEWELNSKDDDQTYRVVDWEALEISVVTVPADQSVGIGRSLARDFATDKKEVTVRAVVPNQPAENAMPDAPEKTEIKETDPLKRVEVVANEHDGAIAAKHEEERVKAIRNLGSVYNVGDDTVSSWISRGTSLGQVSDDIVAIHKKRGEDNPQSHSHLDMSGPDTNRYSLCRAILAAHSDRWSDAGLELECHTEIAERSGKAPEKGVFYVPLDIQRRQVPVQVDRAMNAMGIADPGSRQAFVRDLNTAAGSAGGFLVSSSHRPPMSFNT